MTLAAQDTVDPTDPRAVAATSLTDAMKLWVYDSALPMKTITGAVLKESVNPVASKVQIFASIAALRANALSITVSYVEGYYLAGDQGGGTFVYDSTDTTSPDDGAEIIVDAGGKRHKRQWSGYFDVRFAGARWDNSANDSAAVTAAIAVVSAAGGGTVITPANTGLVSNIVVPGNVILDLNGGIIAAYTGADWIVKLNGQGATIRNGYVNDASLATLYATTTTGSISAGAIGTPVTFGVASVAKLAVGKLISITQTSGQHWVAKITGIATLNITIADGLPVGAANGAAVQTCHGLIMTDQALNGLVEDITFPVAPMGLELVNTQAVPLSHEATVRHIRMDAVYMCGVFRDVDVANVQMYDVIAFGHAGVGNGHVGYYGEGRNPGLYPTGGNAHTDCNFELFDVGWQLRGCQLDRFDNCLGDTNTYLGWDLGAGCQKMRFTDMWAATISGTGGIGVSITGSCLGIFINSLYTRFNTTADLKITVGSQVYLKDETWGESQVFIGGGTYNQVFPTHLGGAPGNESLRVLNHGATQVNRWEIAGNIAGVGVVLNAAGSDTNIDTYAITKGTGHFYIQNNADGTPATLLDVSGPTNAVNYVKLNGVATGNKANITTNAGDLAINSATGVIQLVGTPNLATYANNYKINGAVWAGASPDGLDTYIGNGVGPVSGGVHTNAGGENVGVGFTILQALTTGVANVAIGGGSLAQNATGSFNVGVGRHTMRFHDVGNYNVAIGEFAMDGGSPHNMGNQNVAVGANALINNANAGNSDNVAIGFKALYGNTSGVENVAVGAFAGAGTSFNTSTWTVAVGGAALGANQSGNGNIAIGYQSLGTLTTAANNAIVGFQSFYSTNGANNAGVGYQAGFANTSGAGNAFFGYSAGSTNTTGSNNTTVGNAADLSTAALSGATAIGYNAKVAVSNTTVIGGSANTLVTLTGDARATSVQITDGMTAPGATVGLAKIYVDTSDGDLKVIFGDGTIKTIVVDT